ncbi:HAMP domain-containing histidine kinase [Aldersonia sp. NBC_00410]|uniref:sensor histidine kinase n=1 Tax=Aldersonia sp. NBC_00410 TaxID=2975954 RepID=UPI00224E9D47|nr:HAMP domain-containing sensor histidine kinase [Aldersonia sp. NBC_00410]MCX5042233.1 HAMP domain-containing histidine kinase [Aldersonia sp. NBC_00410]
MRRAFSLRIRVAAATALGATIIVATLGLLAAQALERNNLRQIDLRLETVSRVVLANPELAVRVLGRIGPASNLTLTVRGSDGVASSSDVTLPPLPDGSHTVEVDGEPYRAYTVATPDGAQASIALPAVEAERTTADQRQWVLGGGLLAIAAAGGLGWLLGGRAVLPIVELTRRVRARPPQPIPPVTGVREAEELATAVNDMLARVTAAQAETAAALDTARDFAAVSAHELRTPLTAMRTDLEVLRTLDLDEPQRAEILDDLQRTQGRVEATLTALEKLASGELASQRDHVPTDVAELCDLAAHDARRQFPTLQVRVQTDPTIVISGLPAGLRLAVDNAVSNAVRHGQARNVLISAHRRDDGWVTICVDDDGRGIAPGERRAVFERFHRGEGAAKGGSGLGLALVAQQAQLHGGRAYFEDSPLGGARLVLELAAPHPAFGHDETR